MLTTCVLTILTLPNTYYQITNVYLILDIQRSEYRECNTKKK